LKLACVLNFCDHFAPVGFLNLIDIHDIQFQPGSSAQTKQDAGQMSKRRRPKLGLNLAEINAEDSLEQSFMVQSDAFVNADIRVSSQGLEINQQGSSSSSSSSNAAPMTPIVEGKQSSMPSSTKEKKFIGDLNPNQLETIKELGRGASSYVQLVRDKKTNKSMALKVINVFDKNMRDMLLKEINTLYKVIMAKVAARKEYYCHWEQTTVRKRPHG
jgi:hypothetical protein